MPAFLIFSTAAATTCSTSLILATLSAIFSFCFSFSSLPIFGILAKYECMAILP